MHGEKKRILLAEDDPSLGTLLVDILERRNFSVKLCPDGEAAWKEFLEGAFDLCILDIMLPLKDGFTLAQEIKDRNKNIPILFLTARSFKEDKLKGFDLGAEDYITKPFEEEELLCRIEVIFRRANVLAEDKEMQEIKIGNYLFDPANQGLQINGCIKRLTEKESRILHMLCKRKNALVKREEVLLNIWGDSDYFLGRSLDVFITKLRKYLKDDPHLSIENIHGVGFMLKDLP